MLSFQRYTLLQQALTINTFEYGKKCVGRVEQMLKQFQCNGSNVAQANLWIIERNCGQLN